MQKIALTTVNARFSHASLGLRYLYANLGDHQTNCDLLEFTIDMRASDIAEKLVTQGYSIITFGVYIWNVELINKLIKIIKAVSPQTTLIVGGPEVGSDPKMFESLSLVDHVICGEGEITLPKLLTDIENKISSNKIIEEIKPNLKDILLPYEFYTDEDIKNRNISFEISRGCPFKCEFCLSSLEPKVREFDLDKALGALETLWQRGARKFKFIDRTFNLKMETCAKVLNFFLEKKEQYFLHFEMIPDNLPHELREIISKFPAHALQFEIGIQTFNKEVAERIGRKQDYKVIEDNLAFLEEHTTVHLHTDLIFGLPGEGLESIEQGVNKLVSLTTHEIQMGVLKRLWGTKIDRHTDSFKMQYSTDAPYEILQTDTISYLDMQRLKRFSRFWDLIVNNGNFPETIKIIFGENPFNSFMNLSDWIYSETQQTHKISLERLAQIIATYMESILGLDKKYIHEVITDDYLRVSGRYLPKFLKKGNSEQQKCSKIKGLGRQQKKLGSS